MLSPCSVCNYRPFTCSVRLRRSTYFGHNINSQRSHDREWVYCLLWDILDWYYYHYNQQQHRPKTTCARLDETRIGYLPQPVCLASSVGYWLSRWPLRRITHVGRRSGFNPRSRQSRLRIPSFRGIVQWLRDQKPRIVHHLIKAWNLVHMQSIIWRINPDMDASFLAYRLFTRSPLMLGLLHLDQFTIKKSV